MTTVSHDVFDEHLQVIKALKDNYAERKDQSEVALVLKAQQEIKAACAAREDSVKDTIKALTRSVREVDAAATYPRPEGGHEQQVARLTQEGRAAQEAVQQLHSQLQALQQQREGLAQQFQQLRAKSQHIEEIVTQAEPRTRHQLSLYAHVSHITWDFGKRERVAGTVSNPNRGQLQPFDFDPQQAPTPEVVNALWDLIGTDP